MKSPKEIVNMMMAEDKFSQWLDISLKLIEKGECMLSCEVKDEMVNGFNVAHGGITYSLSDSTMAFASNSYGFKCMSIETSISHLKKVMTGDILTSESYEIKRGKSIAIYEVKIVNQHNQLVSHFKGTVQITENSW